MPIRPVTSASKSREHLKGWDHAQLKGAKPITNAIAAETLEITLVLRPRKTLGPQCSKHLTHKKFESQHCANATDVTRSISAPSAVQLAAATDRVGPPPIRWAGAAGVSEVVISRAAPSRSG